MTDTNGTVRLRNFGLKFASAKLRAGRICATGRKEKKNKERRKEARQ